MSAPKPSDIKDKVIRIRKSAKKIEELYKWAHSLGYNKSVLPKDSPDRMARNRFADPTGAVVADDRLQEIRTQVQLAAQQLDTALGHLLGAERKLKRLVGRGKDADDDTQYPESQFPRTVGRAQMRQLKEAQRRRVARGESYGEA